MRNMASGSNALGNPAASEIGAANAENNKSSTSNSSNMKRVYGKVPKFLYGTAWKKERTEELVYQALKAGFRGIDTAAQPRHYREDLVGKGIKRAIQDGIVTREELYVRRRHKSLITPKEIVGTDIS